MYQHPKRRSGSKSSTPAHEPLHRTDPFSNRSATLSLTPGTILGLQPVIGNKAIQRLLAQSPSRITHTASRQTIQRQPYGLDQHAPIDDFTDKAADIWSKQPNMSIRDFVFKLMGIISFKLDDHKVPPCGWALDPNLGVHGKFDQKQWKMFINPTLFSTNTNATVLKNLTEAEVTEVVGTLYHEARHADQDFLIARVLAGKGMNVDQIVAKTKMPKVVVEEADAIKLIPSSQNKGQVAHAEKMFDVMYGEHNEILTLLMEKSEPLIKVLAVTQAVTQSTLAQATQEMSGFMPFLETWSKSTLKTKIKTLKAKSNKSSTEVELLKGLEQLDTKLDAVLKAWKKITTPTVSNVQSFGKVYLKFIEELQTVSDKLEGEADAKRVEAKVKGEFGKKI
jgi:hypothetical protein